MPRRARADRPGGSSSRIGALFPCRAVRLVVFSGAEQREADAEPGPGSRRRERRTGTKDNCIKNAMKSAKKGAGPSE